MSVPGERLSRPLNSRERARARRLGCDWMIGRGQRRPSRGARVHFPRPAPSSHQRGRCDARGSWGEGGGAAVKSSRLIGSLGTHGSYAGKKPQLPACAVSKTGARVCEGGCGRSTARAQARECVCVPAPAAIPVHPERWGREPSPEVR